MQDNVWRVNPNNYFRLNFDDNAVEIIDQYDKVAISVELMGNRAVRIMGAFNITSYGWILIDDKGMTNLPTFQDAKRDGRESEWEDAYNRARNNTPRIFSYEGLEYMGKRLNNK